MGRSSSPTLNSDTNVRQITSEVYIIKKRTYLINFDEIILEMHKDVCTRIFFSKWLRNSNNLERLVLRDSLKEPDKECAFFFLINEAKVFLLP